ncbi:MAG TPA: PAS domain S-box protein [Anaerolineales bacterium]|nr:PAS domain S-box protein [Anaerolineales bacterium]
MKTLEQLFFLDQQYNKKTKKIALFSLSLLILLGIGIVAILHKNAGNPLDLFVLLLGVIPILIAIGFNYAEKTEIAGAIIGAALAIIFTILASIGQGVYDIGTMAYPAILIIASLFLKRNTVFFLTGLVILCNGWLVFGAMYGIYQPNYPMESFFRQFIIISIILLTTMFAVHILSNTVRHSLVTAQNELQERRKIEQALREAETMYRALVEQTSVATYRDEADEKAKALYISPQIENILGYSKDEWQENPYLWESLLHPDDHAEIMKDIQGYIKSGEKSITEYRLRTKDKGWIWVRDESVVVKDKSGVPKYVQGVLIDITDKKLADQKIKQRELILSAVAEITQLLFRSTNWKQEIDAILGLLGRAADASHVYLYENHRDPEGVLLSSQTHEWVAPGFASDIADPATQNLRLEKTDANKDWFDKLSKGEYFYGNRREHDEFFKSIISTPDLIALLEVPVFWNGEWQGIIGFDHYIEDKPWSQGELDALIAAAGILSTAIERQIKENNLRASEERFNLAFRHTYVSMAIVRTSDHRILEVNDSFSKVTGYPLDEAIGKRAGRDLDIWFDQKDRNYIIASLTTQGFVDEYKAKFRRKNGDVGTGLLYAVNVMIASEACQLYSFVDISDIDQLLDELKTKNDELQAFTYTVSHDLKAPLVTISGFMGYLEQDARSGDIERLNKDILRINESISKMQRLLDELLELSRIGRMANPPEDVAFDEIVQEALRLVEGRLKEKQVQVKVDADLPKIYGDRARIVQVVQNLVDNAAKYFGEQKKPTIRIGYQEDDGKPVFFVRDNGRGIESEHFERVFGLFNKLEANSEGTGIGLALAKRIIEVHNGKIWVESKGLGKGSTFYFTLAERPHDEAQNDEE